MANIFAWFRIQIRSWTQLLGLPGYWAEVRNSLSNAETKFESLNGGAPRHCELRWLPKLFAAVSFIYKLLPCGTKILTLHIGVADLALLSPSASLLLLTSVLSRRVRLRLSNELTSRNLIFNSLSFSDCPT